MPVRTIRPHIVYLTGAKKAPLSTIVKAALYATVMAYEKIYGLPN